MEQPLISIIIPVYNVEPYLERCLDSVIGQTYINLEIILIDDGSTDGSGKICDEYANKDSRIKVKHQTNGGLSCARNTGLDICLGNYITFVDSDDWVDRNFIEYLFALAHNNKCELSICPLNVVRKKAKPQCFANDKGEIITIEQCLRRMLNGDDISISACGKMYSKRLFEKTRFPVGRIYEDTGTTYKIVCDAKKICVGKAKLYHYRIRPMSIMSTEFDERKLDAIVLTDRMCDDIDKLYPCLENVTKRRRAYVRLHLLRMMDGGCQMAEEIRTEVLGMKNYIYHNPEASIRDIIGMFALEMNYSTFRMMWQAYQVFRR